MAFGDHFGRVFRSRACGQPGLYRAQGGVSDEGEFLLPAKILERKSAAQSPVHDTVEPGLSLHKDSSIRWLFFQLQYRGRIHNPHILNLLAELASCWFPDFLSLIHPISRSVMKDKEYEVVNRIPSESWCLMDSRETPAQSVRAKIRPRGSALFFSQRSSDKTVKGMRQDLDMMIRRVRALEIPPIEGEHTGLVLRIS